MMICGAKEKLLVAFAAMLLGLAVFASPVVAQAEEKVELPSISKEVCEDRDGSWGSIADASVGQEVSYRITGTIPDTIEKFESYPYVIEDVCDPSLDIVEDSVSVWIVSNDMPSKALDSKLYETKLSGDTLEVKLDAVACKLTPSDKVQVRYEAVLSSEGVRLGFARPHENKARLSYPKTPEKPDELTHTEWVDCELVTYGLRISKLDTSGKTLIGASFAIHDVDRDMWLTNMGVWDKSYSKACDFACDANGVLRIPGLDEGSYEVYETVTPAGYEPLKAPSVFRIGSDLSSRKLFCELLSGNAELRSVSSSDGEALASVRNQKIEEDKPSDTPSKTPMHTDPQPSQGRRGSGPMAKTGDTSVSVAVLAGMGVAGLGLVLAGMRSRRDKDEE